MATTIFDLPVHPAAEIFPMLEEDELTELAEDIKANGLIHPLIVKDGLLIDGRNRREACKRVGVTPTTVELDGQNPAVYILSVNINRRHMNKGQRAMATAMLFPEVEKRGGRRDRGQSVKNTDCDSSYVSHARTVLKSLPEVAQAVLAGMKPLNEAYAEAKAVKDRAESLRGRLDRLQKQAPDLANLIQEEKLTVNEAETVLDERRAQERRIRQGVWDFFKRLEIDLPILTTESQITHMRETYKEFPHEFAIQMETSITELIDKWIAGLSRIRKGL